MLVVRRNFLGYVLIVASIIAFMKKKIIKNKVLSMFNSCTLNPEAVCVTNDRYLLLLLL